VGFSYFSKAVSLALPFAVCCGGLGIPLACSSSDTVVPQHSLLAAERYFIRALRPVFNWQCASERTEMTTTSCLMLADDVMVQASKVLRRSHPKLSSVQWTSLISKVVLAGERTLAAKLARHARLTGSGLSKLRAFPQVVIPYPVLVPVVLQLHCLVKSVLQDIPHCLRTPQCAIQIAVGRVCWSKTPFAEAVVAPALLPVPCSTVCHCHLLPSQLQVRGHVCTRSWSILLCCSRLYQLVGDR